MSNYIIVRIPKRPKRATERLLANETKVIDRDGRVIYTWFSCPRCGRVYVESGEGIESSSPRRASRSASAGSMWNPVKELKVVFLDVFRYHSDRWNPVKELKGLFGMP